MAGKRERRGFGAVGMWRLPVLIILGFGLFAAFSLVSIRSAARERFLQDAMANIRVLEVAFADVIAHGESFAMIQQRIDRLSRGDPRIFRLSFITRDRDGELRHVASTMPARVGAPAFPEDVEAMGRGRVVVLDEKCGDDDCLDITYPVRDAAGRVVGLIGYTVRRGGTGAAPFVLAGAAVLMLVCLLAHFRRVQVTFLAELDRRRRIEEKLREAKSAAERANRLKDQFLANVSHEIRTPLNGIMGMAGVLARSGLPDEAAGQARMILAAGDRLLAVVNDILDLSRIEAGTMGIACEDFDLRRLVADVLHPLAVRAREKGLTLEWEVAEDVPSMLAGDPGRLAQVLNNLVGNAVKYTGAGGVSMRVSLDGEAHGRPRLMFVVADTGPGVPPEDRDLVFEPFFQAGGAGAAGGTGLGLAISRRIVRLMGGDLWLEDGGPGAVFCFTVVFARCASDPPPETDSDPGADLPVPGPGVRILLAEDDGISRAVAEAMLAEKGWRATVAENGADAVDAFARGEFDVVLMDVTMPVMDGFEATAKIREIESSRGLPRTPVVALTAHAVSGYRERCLAAGMDDYLPKPFDADALAAVVARHAAGGAGDRG